MFTIWNPNGLPNSGIVNELYFKIAELDNNEATRLIKEETKIIEQEIAMIKANEIDNKTK